MISSQSFRVLTLLAAALATALTPTLAQAFTVQSGFTDACHERISIASFFIGRGAFEGVPVDQIPEGPWGEILTHLYPESVDFSLSDRFVLFSVVVGARSPDSEGFSLTNLAVLRAVQSDPEGQYIHCLRAAEDDFEEGNDSALAGCRGVIRSEMATAYGALTRGSNPLIDVSMTLENYGTIEVEVSEVGYHFGRALHTLQDSFTHTLRTPDLRSVVHVMNYEAAIANTLDEERDGMPHSAAADSCVTVGGITGELVNRARVYAAVEAGADLLRAFVRVTERAETGEAPASEAQLGEEVESVLLKWFRPADANVLGYTVCTVENDYCQSPWLETARLLPAGPVLSCTASPNRSRVPRSISLVAFVLFVRVAKRSRAPRRSSR